MTRPTNPLLRSLGGYPLAAYQELRASLAASGPVHDFSIGDPVEPTPAFVRQALVDGVPAVSQYPSAAGPAEVREAIAGWVRRRFDVEVDPDTQVLPTAGSKEAVFHMPLALCDPHGQRRAAIWGDPGYPVYGRGQQFAGGVSDPEALTHDGRWLLDLPSMPSDRLRRASVAWLNYPHNPTGAVADLDHYRAALDTAREHGFVLASDECYADIYPPDDDPPPSALQAATSASGAGGAGGDLSGLVVAFSLSKRSGMTGYRCGALVGDPELIADQRTLRPNIGTASPDFVQAAAIAAWSEDTHAAQRRQVFADKRTVLLEFFEQVGITVSGSQATFYLWVAAPGEDDAAYAEALLRERVIVSPGRAFGPAGQGWLRLALVPSVEGCREAATLWAEAIAAGRLPGHEERH